MFTEEVSYEPNTSILEKKIMYYIQYLIAQIKLNLV